MIATLQLVDDQTKKKIPGFHTGLVKMYENEHQPPEKGEKRCILSSFPVYGSEISVMMAIVAIIGVHQSQIGRKSHIWHHPPKTLEY